MKTKEIKEELDRELDEATPNINVEKVKKHKISLIDDYTIVTHKKMEKLRFITAGALFLVVALACLLVVTNVVEFGTPQKRTRVTCYILTGLMPDEKVHIITKDGVVEERFSVGKVDAEKYLEKNESLKNYKGAEAAEYIHNLILVMVETAKTNVVPIKLQAINNSYDESKEDLQDIKEELIRLNVGETKKIHLEIEPIQFGTYNNIINLETNIDDLDSQLEIILDNNVKGDTED